MFEVTAAAEKYQQIIRDVLRGCEGVIKSSILGMNICLVRAFSLRSVCVPFINMYKGRVHDVIYCYTLGKKWVPPFSITTVYSTIQP